MLSIVTTLGLALRITAPTSDATVIEAPVVAPAANGPVVPQGAPPPPVYLMPPPPIGEPPRGTWMRVSGGLAVGVGSLLGVSALICFATTDALAQDDLRGREVLELTAFGLGLGALAHLGAGIPLLVVGKQRKRRHEEWSRRVSVRPRLGAGAQGVRVGLTLRF